MDSPRTSPDRRPPRAGARWGAAAVAAALGVSVTVMTIHADAAPADFDPTFAAAGRYPLGAGFRIVGLAQGADDRFVTVSIRPGNNDTVDVRRFSPSGAADPSFAVDGDVQVGGGVNWLTPAVAVDTVRGLTYVSAYAQGPGVSRVWRFTAAGALDPAWGGVGRVDFAATRLLDIALQPSGQLVVANNNSVYRLTSAGTIDPAFGVAGGVTLGTGQIDSLRTSADGDIVAAGRTAATIDVFRLNPGGGVDNRFGTNGRATHRPTPPLGWTIANIEPVTVGVQNDGAIVVASGADEVNPSTGSHRFPLIVTRFTKDGGNDSTFRTKHDYTVAISGKLSIQANDKVVIPVTNGNRAALHRLEPDGAQDAGFGIGGGWTDAEIGSRPTATLVQRAGRIVVTGFAAGGTGLLWAFQGDRTPTCGGRYATVYGARTSDTLYGSDGPDVVVGGKGKDKLSTGAGADRVCGGQGRDVLIGGSGRDRLDGGADADTLRGLAGQDTLNGGGGDDRLEGNGAKDTLNGGPGGDRLYGGPDRDKLNGGPGRDLVRQ